MKRVLQGFLLALITLPALSALGDDVEVESPYDSGFVPKRLSQWPDALKDYQMLPGSQSPDGKHGFIYPKRSVVETDHFTIRLYVATLAPFRILAELPIKGENLAGNVQGSYQVNWARDSLSAVFIANAKWGPRKVFVVPVHSDDIGAITDLTTEVSNLVRPMFVRDKVRPFNGNFDFIFESLTYHKDAKGKWFEVDTQWRTNDRNQVLVNCFCTNESRTQDFPDIWEINFVGIWDIAQGRFLQYRCLRTPQNELGPQR